MCSIPTTPDVGNIRDYEALSRSWSDLCRLKGFWLTGIRKIVKNEGGGVSSRLDSRQLAAIYSRRKLWCQDTSVWHHMDLGQRG
jgi:hypothetical protein